MATVMVKDCWLIVLDFTDGRTLCRMKATCDHYNKTVTEYQKTARYPKRLGLAALAHVRRTIRDIHAECKCEGKREGLYLAQLFAQMCAEPTPGVLLPDASEEETKKIDSVVGGRSPEEIIGAWDCDSMPRTLIICGAFLPKWKESLPALHWGVHHSGADLLAKTLFSAEPVRTLREGAMTREEVSLSCLIEAAASLRVTNPPSVKREVSAAQKCGINSIVGLVRERSKEFVTTRGRESRRENTFAHTVRMLAVNYGLKCVSTDARHIARRMIAAYDTTAPKSEMKENIRGTLNRLGLIGFKYDDFNPCDNYVCEIEKRESGSCGDPNCDGMHMGPEILGPGLVGPITPEAFLAMISRMGAVSRDG